MGPFDAGVISGMEKVANEDAYYSLELAEDTRVRTMRDLMRMAPEVRKRYLADMAAKNHRMAMETPRTV